jgi:hypothetical protein
MTALEHERSEIEEALVALLGQKHLKKIRSIIVAQLPEGTEINATADRKMVLLRILRVFERSFAQ